MFYCLNGFIKYLYGAKKNDIGTKENPWTLKTPPGSSEYIMYKDDAVNPPVLVCKVGSTILNYQWGCIEDLHAMLKNHSDWMELGSADEQKPAKEGTVEAWGRSTKTRLVDGMD